MIKLKDLLEGSKGLDMEKGTLDGKTPQQYERFWKRMNQMSDYDVFSGQTDELIKNNIMKTPKQTQLDFKKTKRFQPFTDWFLSLDKKKQNNLIKKHSQNYFDGLYDE